MRLRRLDLIRYGHFTDRAIDFGERAEDAPDFHVIHGPNEAGKSTIFSAWLDFLYGIDPRSPYNFLHDYRTMRIGASIETAAGKRELVRVKKQAGSLLDGHDQPVGDALLAGELGGLDRDAYRTMFSLDETSLEEGGESILASKGDLGQLLFSASAGLSDLASRLDRIREQTDQFHRPRAHKSDLADLKRRLDDLKAERDAIDIAASEHARLVSERERARRAHDDANRRRAALRVQLESSTARLSILPQLGRLGRLRDDFAGMEVVPQAPAGWRQEIAEITRRQVELQTALARLDRDIAAIDSETAAAPPRDPLLDRAAALEALQEPAGRALSEERDLPNRIEERRAAQQSIAAIVARLGAQVAGDPRRLLLPAKVLGVLRSLMTRHSGIEARRETAAREEEDTRQALEGIRAQWAREVGDRAPSGPDPHHLADLAEHLSALRAVDFDHRAAATRRAVDEALDQFERRVAQLRPWAGDAETLADVVAPPQAVLTELGRRLADAAEKVRDAERERERCRSELLAIRAEHTAASDAPGIVGDSAATATRATRERAWTELKAKLDGPSADRFREALDADDRVQLQRMAHLSEITRLRNLEQSIARLEAHLVSAESNSAAAVQAELLLRRQLADLVESTGSGLPEDMDLVAFEAWCSRLLAAQEAHEGLLRARRDLDAVDRAIDSRSRALRETLRGLGVDRDRDDLFQLAAVARRLQDDEGRRSALRDAMRLREAEFEWRRAEREAAETAQTAWNAAWHDALAGSWLMAHDTPPTVMEMEEILRLSAALEAEIERQAGLDDRIGKMERDMAGFAADVAGLARDHGLASDEPPHALYRRLVERLSTARAHEARAQAARDRREGLAAERFDVVQESETLAGRVRLKTAHYGVATLAEVEVKLALADRRETLRAEVEQLESEIAESLGARDLTEIDAILTTVDRDALAAEIEAVKPEVEALDRETSRAYADFVAAENKLAGLGSDGEAARLAELRRTVLLEIEDGARHYLELRLGAIATDQALRLYRDRHQSSMMRRASEAFNQLSRGNYRNLVAQRDGQREVLIAVGADGSSKQAKDLSKGTQFQLYLALRVAGYQEYAATRPTVPFIADDIMESFDEDRSEEALTQLSIMARSGQVVYLTHHRHICDIAKAVCPTVKVHELG